jgi:hypothetical protein
MMFRRWSRSLVDTPIAARSSRTSGLRPGAGAPRSLIPGARTAEPGVPCCSALDDVRRDFDARYFSVRNGLHCATQLVIGICLEDIAGGAAEDGFRTARSAWPDKAPPSSPDGPRGSPRRLMPFMSAWPAHDDDIRVLPRGARSVAARASPTTERERPSPGLRAALLGSSDDRLRGGFVSSSRSRAASGQNCRGSRTPPRRNDQERGVDLGHVTLVVALACDRRPSGPRLGLGGRGQLTPLCGSTGRFVGCHLTAWRDPETRARDHLQRAPGRFYGSSFLPRSAASQCGRDRLERPSGTALEVGHGDRPCPHATAQGRRSGHSVSSVLRDALPGRSSTIARYGDSSDGDPVAHRPQSRTHTSSPPSPGASPRSDSSIPAAEFPRFAIAPAPSPMEHWLAPREEEEAGWLSRCR